MTQDIKKIGIIAGGGALPDAMVEHCANKGIPFQVITFKGQPQPQKIEDYEIHVTELALGQVGKVMETFKEKLVTHVVMVGHLEKPSLFDLRFDMLGLKLMNSVRRKHDDELLNTVCTFLEKEGFEVLGAHELAPQLLMPKGILGKHKPTSAHKEDISIGLEALKQLGCLDIGQAVIVKDGVVIGVEAVEGTMGLIERCATLRGAKNKGGILIKAAKKEQNLKVDMPTVGDQTIEKLAEFKYEGLAVVAEKALLVEKDQAVKAANKTSLFLCGVDENGQYA